MIRLTNNELKNLINNMEEGEKLSVIWLDSLSDSNNNDEYAIILEDETGDVLDCIETGFTSEYEARKRLKEIGYY